MALTRSHDKIVENEYNYQLLRNANAEYERIINEQTEKCNVLRL